MSLHTSSSDTDKREGTIRWTTADPSKRRAAVEQLATLLRNLAMWPVGEFATSWWSGDYRLLELTFRLTADEDGIVTCHSTPGAEFIDIAVVARVRSKGRTRALTASEHAALAGAGFGASSEGGAELLYQARLNDPEGLVDRILSAMSDAFKMPRGAVIRYRIIEGSRLGEMPVFEDIRPHELMELIKAAEFDARWTENSGEPVIEVADAAPFTIRFLEPRGGGYLTIHLEAEFSGNFSLESVNEVNRDLHFGTAAKEEHGASLRHRICVTGGMSHAAIRDRIDDWVSSCRRAKLALKDMRS